MLSKGFRNSPSSSREPMIYSNTSSVNCCSTEVPFSTAVCFALALFFSPLFLAIPSAATAPALIIVGVMMMPAVRRIHWEDYCRAIPAFLTIILMPLAYSISDGILIGVISYVICHAIAGKFKQVSITMWIYLN